MIYILDTNVISDAIESHTSVISHLENVILNGHMAGICYPVYYEILRGLYWKPSKRKMSILQNKILPQLDWIDIKPADWVEAARLWAGIASKGKHASDTDLLLVSLTNRLAGILVSRDNDFDALPVKRENCEFRRYLMTNLHEIFRQLDELSAEELTQIQTHISAKQADIAQQNLSPEALEEWMNKLDEAIETFRDGLSESELENILQAMSEK